MSSAIYPVILCGGSGTRLWPLSTPESPKQFLSLVSAKTMLEETAQRFGNSGEAGVSFGTPLIVGSAKHERHLQACVPDAKTLLEPVGRNSAPAVAAACLVHAPDDLLLIVPADHDIRDVAAFHAAIAIAQRAAQDGAIVTFGIEPTFPATGYGYIKAGDRAASGAAIDVEAFVEKPDQSTAESYLASGAYFWNAGIFMFKTSVMLDALREHAPDIVKQVEAAIPDASASNIYLEREAFSASPGISIDYAVMEKVKNVKTVPVQMGWSDVGGYRALHELLTDKREDTYTRGPIHVQNGSSLYVRSEGPAVAVNGVSNLAIVATANEVMITPLDDDAAVKTLGAEIQTKRYRLGLSQKLISQVRDWMWQTFDVWARISWDKDRGGFVEQISLDGVPDAEANRRVRVQARQVFSFARAIQMGWSRPDLAEDLVKKGLDYIDTRLRHPDGGWVHVVAPDGTPVDDRRDLYDHAFIILAGTAAFEAIGDPRALRIADDAIAFVDAELKDPVHGGWREAKPDVLPRRANPHMHLLEAMLEYHRVTGCARALERAREIVILFETRFFDPATNIMAEYFDADWSPYEAHGARLFEPGHHFEWATLLSEFEDITGHDTLSWRRRLIRHAEHTGLNSKTGCVWNSVDENGMVINENSRLWGQLERVRAARLHPSISSPESTEALIELIYRTYLTAGPLGGWMDEIDAAGAPVSQQVPASMLYHLVTAFDDFGRT